jgi:hypothetical protein
MRTPAMITEETTATGWRVTVAHATEIANHADKTFWRHCPGGFQNVYIIGIATSADGRNFYRSNGYDAISSYEAIRELTNKGRAGETVNCRVTANGDEFPCDRINVGHALRKGEPVVDADGRQL